MSLIKPTEAELEILQILWEIGSCTVKLINNRLNETKKVGYTTSLKIMQIMTEKGILTVNKDSRQHVYSPAFDEEETQNSLLNSFLQKTFSGSASKLVMQALGNHKTSKNELEKIKEFINQLEKNK